MGLKMKNFLGLTETFDFQAGEGSRKDNIKKEDCLKREAWTVCWFKEEVARNREGVDTPMHTVSSQNIQSSSYHKE